VFVVVYILCRAIHLQPNRFQMYAYNAVVHVSNIDYYNVMFLTRVKRNVVTIMFIIFYVRLRDSHRSK
jgi:hypothetical protein